jgi:dienelactone hydrolase
MSVTARQTNAVARPRLYLVAALQSLIETSTGPLHAHHALGRPPANLARRICIGRELLTAAVLALSCYTGAAAQSGTGPSDAATRAFGPKQVGPWTISGFTSDTGPQCSAEHQVPGGAGRGSMLQFALILSRYSSWIGIGAEDWQLNPNAVYPVELMAPPILRGERSAVARSGQVAWIELGPFWPRLGLLQSLAKWSAIEIKTAQGTFKLPLDGFDRALPELDTCLNAVERPPELAEDHTFLTVQGYEGRYRLEALMVRPQKAEGRLPIALITHGRSGDADDNTAEDDQSVRADLMLRQARDLALRGWLAAAAVRRGYGRSDGLPASRTTHFKSCEEGDLTRALDMEADDLDATLKAIAARPDADGSRAIAIGDSLGGSAVLALAGRQPAGLRGVVNVSGGVRRTEGGNVCSHDGLVAAMANLGARTRIATLWLYAENDSLFPPATVQRMREAYAKAGGRAELRMLPRIFHDGHNLFADFKGRGYWLRAFDDFLRAQGLPNANDERVEGLMRVAKLPASVRADVESYFSIPMPRILVVSPSRAVYWIHENNIYGARKRILAACRAQAGAACSVLMENNRLVPPAATSENP